MIGTGEGDMDFRGNLEVRGPEYVPEAETHGGPTRTPGRGEDFIGSTSGEQKMEGEYGRGRD